MVLHTLARYLMLHVMVVSTKSQSLCADGITEFPVSSTAQALELSSALLCSGPGQFEVGWSGNVLISRTLILSNGTSLRVAGAGTGVIDGGGVTQLFEVEGGASLELNGMSLTGGLASSGASSSGHGGAVYLAQDSQLSAVDCSFFGNNADCVWICVWPVRTCLCSADAPPLALMSRSSDMDVQESSVWLHDSCDIREWQQCRHRGRTGFRDSSVGIDGGAIYVEDTRLRVGGDTSFAGNVAGNMSAIGAVGGALAIFGGDCAMDGNTTFTGNSLIGNTSAEATLGGGVYVKETECTFSGTTSLMDNAAAREGALRVFGGGF